jgi:hypothetical protein
VRPHIDPVTDQEFGWSHLIEKYKRPDHLFLRRGQCPAHLETAEIAGTRHDYVLNGVTR